MICTHCGHTMPDGSLTCDACGTYLGRYATATPPDSGVRAIRQGRVSATGPTLPPSHSGRMREYGDYDLSALPPENDNAPFQRRVPRMEMKGSSRPDTRRGVPVKGHSRTTGARDRKQDKKVVRRSNINWMKLGAFAIALMVAACVALLVYIGRSEQGQRAKARRNALSTNEAFFQLAQNTDDPLVQSEREELLSQWNGVNPQAYWLAGQDYLEVGDVETAISCFRIGDIIDPDNYDGMVLLANAYELNMQDDQAETLYLHMLEDVAPFRTEAYTALIRMYQEQGRDAEAADMMLLAYQNTDRESYYQERKEFIPLSPEVSMTGGRYNLSKIADDIYLSSPQGYDIYYTLDEKAKLPEEGILAEEGKIEPAEGSITIRAVCVSGELVSDPISVSYTFYYPSPPAPKANLAPGTYKRLYTVSLRPGDITDDDLSKQEIAEMESQYEYYYTIDGSIPTPESSPRYTGEPIVLPPGRVYLKAICVNQYGKSSSVREVDYKFTVKPDPLKMYAETDTFSGFVLNKTSMDDFISTFGQPRETMDSVYLSLTNTCRHLSYDWGYAVFILDSSSWQLVRIEMNRQIATPPRGVGFGSTEAEVTGVYKDFAQPEGGDGTRGLYYDYPNVGKVLIAQDGTRYIQYTLSTAASKTWVLQYWLKNGKVNRIVHYYQP